MTRAPLEHLLRAAGDLCEEDEVIVIGSQAILGQFPDAPEARRVSAGRVVAPAEVGRAGERPAQGSPNNGCGRREGITGVTSICRPKCSPYASGWIGM